jgi:serine/threonine-protein kinase
MDAANPPGEPPDALPPHEILEEIARNAVGGVVYRARDIALDRIVTLRVLSPNMLPAEQIGPFLREVRAAAQIRHYHLLPIFAVGMFEGRACVTTKCAANGTLAQRRDQFRDPRAAAGLIEKLAWATAAAHAHGLIHGDLKPSAVLFDERDEPMVAAVGDEWFLWWRQETCCLGAPPYSAPERFTAPSDGLEASFDVWALGVLLYELLTGRRPFQGRDPKETIQHVLAARPEPPRRLRPDIAPELEAVVLRCLEKKPNDRYGSARALAQDLERWLRAEPTLARPPTLTQRILRGLSRALGGGVS